MCEEHKCSWCGKDAVVGGYDIRLQAFDLMEKYGLTLHDPMLQHMDFEGEGIRYACLEHLSLMPRTELYHGRHVH